MKNHENIRVSWVGQSTRVIASQVSKLSSPFNNFLQKVEKQDLSKGPCGKNLSKDTFKLVDKYFLEMLVTSNQVVSEQKSWLSDICQIVFTHIGHTKLPTLELVSARIDIFPRLYSVQWSNNSVVTGNTPKWAEVS